MKGIFITLIFLMTGFFLPAQDGAKKEKPAHGKALAGITAGGGLATFLYDYGTLGGEPPSGYLPVPAAGLTFDFESRGSFSFLMGLYLKGGGEKIDMADYVAGWKFPQNPGSTIRADAQGSISTSIYWFELPMALTFNFGRPNRVQFGFGPFAAYGLTGKEKRDFSIQYYLEDEFLTEETQLEEKDLILVNLLADSEADPEVRQINRLNYGLYLLLGFKIPHLAVTFSSSIGFANLIPLGGEDLFSSQKTERRVRSFTPALTLTYFINK